jgi:hypothetical protein
MLHIVAWGKEGFGWTDRGLRWTVGRTLGPRLRWTIGEVVRWEKSKGKWGGRRFAITGLGKKQRGVYVVTREGRWLRVKNLSMGGHVSGEMRLMGDGGVVDQMWV